MKKYFAFILMYLALFNMVIAQRIIELPIVPSESVTNSESMNFQVSKSLTTKPKN